MVCNGLICVDVNVWLSLSHFHFIMFSMKLFLVSQFINGHHRIYMLPLHILPRARRKERGLSGEIALCSDQTSTNGIDTPLFCYQRRRSWCAKRCPFPALFAVFFFLLKKKNFHLCLSLWECINRRCWCWCDGSLKSRKIIFMFQLENGLSAATVTTTLTYLKCTTAPTVYIFMFGILCDSIATTEAIYACQCMGERWVNDCCFIFG